jgi:hypothetical protein
LIIGSMVNTMPGTSFFERARAAVVQHLRLFVELAADAVAAELAHDRKAVVLGKGLDRSGRCRQAEAPGLTFTMPRHMAS